MDKNDLENKNFGNNKNFKDNENKIVASAYDNDGILYEIDLLGRCYQVAEDGERILIKDAEQIKDIKNMFKSGQSDVIYDSQENINDYERE